MEETWGINAAHLVSDMSQQDLSIDHLFSASYMLNLYSLFYLGKELLSIKWWLTGGGGKRYLKIYFIYM